MNPDLSRKSQLDIDRMKMTDWVKAHPIDWKDRINDYEAKMRRASTNGDRHSVAPPPAVVGSVLRDAAA